jgi:hypothetical protein
MAEERATGVLIHMAAFTRGDAMRSDQIDGLK